MVVAGVEVTGQHHISRPGYHLAERGQVAAPLRQAHAHGSTRVDVGQIDDGPLSLRLGGEPDQRHRKIGVGHCPGALQLVDRVNSVPGGAARGGSDPVREQLAQSGSTQPLFESRGVFLDRQQGNAVLADQPDDFRRVRPAEFGIEAHRPELQRVPGRSFRGIRLGLAIVQRDQPEELYGHEPRGRPRHPAPAAQHGKQQGDAGGQHQPRGEGHQLDNGGGPFPRYGTEHGDHHDGCCGHSRHQPPAGGRGPRRRSRGSAAPVPEHHGTQCRRGRPVPVVRLLLTALTRPSPVSFRKNAPAQRQHAPGPVEPEG